MTAFEPLVAPLRKGVARRLKSLPERVLRLVSGGTDRLPLVEETAHRLAGGFPFVGTGQRLGLGDDRLLQLRPLLDLFEDLPLQLAEFGPDCRRLLADLLGDLRDHAADPAKECGAVERGPDFVGQRGRTLLKLRQPRRLVLDRLGFLGRGRLNRNRRRCRLWARLVDLDRQRVRYRLAFGGDLWLRLGFRGRFEDRCSGIRRGLDWCDGFCRN